MSYSTTMRIGGLASGLDIDQIVSDLMKAERLKVDKLYQQKQILEWQKADYREINLKLRALYNATFDMKLTSSYLKYEAVGTMNDGTDFDKYFTVSPGSAAVPGEYKVKVEQTAGYAELKSSHAIAGPMVGETSPQLEEIVNSDGGKFYVTIDGVKKLVTLNITEKPDGTYQMTDLADDLQTSINDAFGGLERVKVEVKDGVFAIQPAEDFSKVPITLSAAEEDNILEFLGFEDGASYSPLDLTTTLKSLLPDYEEDTISFKINGYEFEFDAESSLQLVLDKINNTSEVGVTARYDELTDKLFLLSRETGLGAQINIEDGSGLFKSLGFEMEELADDEGTIYTTSVSGQNARIVLNGTIVEKTTNEFAINGIRFNLHEAMEEGQEATFRLENDPDAAVESIKEYIELYNETIDLINTKLSEERYRDYAPLTEEQKQEMSEKEIELWEEKAKSGLLRSDQLLNSIVSDLRFAMSNSVEGQPDDMKALSSIGITTLTWKEKGKLYINEEKLRNALAEDPEAVMRLFNSAGDDFSEKGVITRVYDILKDGIEDLTEKAGGGEFQIYDDSILGEQIRDMEERISSMEEMLLSTEERYWQKFTAMEQAIQYANQQSMWLATQLNMYTGY